MNCQPSGFSISTIEGGAEMLDRADAADRIARIGFDLEASRSEK